MQLLFFFWPAGNFLISTQRNKNGLTFLQGYILLGSYSKFDENVLTFKRNEKYNHPTIKTPARNESASRNREPSNHLPSRENCRRNNNAGLGASWEVQVWSSCFLMLWLCADGDPPTLYAEPKHC